jgi:hypothetical protein
VPSLPSTTAGTAARSAFVSLDHASQVTPSALGQDFDDFFLL